MLYRLLLVDDQPAVRALVALELERMGFKVTTTATGHEALQLIDEIPLHIVVLDVILEQMDGLELLGLIKKRHPRLPVVILTGAGYTPEVMSEALAKGADGYVSKGLSMSHLVMELHRILGNGKSKVNDET